MKLQYASIDSYHTLEYQSFYNKLNSSEKTKVDKLLTNQNKRLCLLVRILFNKLLLENYSLNYFCLKYWYNPYGKPLCHELFFNFSHSNKYGICAISNKPIGVDIEYIRKVDLSVISYFCTTKEQEFILHSKNKYKTLFTYFCLKEAYFKMIGTGIKDFKSLEFVIQKNRVLCSNQTLNIKLIHKIPNYVIAVIESKN